MKDDYIDPEKAKDLYAAILVRAWQDLWTVGSYGRRRDDVSDTMRAKDFLRSKHARKLCDILNLDYCILDAMFKKKPRLYGAGIGNIVGKKQHKGKHDTK